MSLFLVFLGGREIKPRETRTAMWNHWAAGSCHPWCNYAKMPSCGFQKPDPTCFGVSKNKPEPKFMCVSCGSDVGKTRNAAQRHFNDNYFPATGTLRCNPYNSGTGTNPDLKAARVSWLVCVWNEPNVQYLPTTKAMQCPICFEERQLVPVCEGEHLVCRSCECKIEGKACPLCRRNIITANDRLMLSGWSSAAV
tara:strand:+ start:9055 stop:9639 length:585 start_codon:yes stop_codon:yes gene_type:complete